ncbi:unnamed protein product [Prunus armeniaca]
MSPPPTQPSAATAPAQMDYMLVGPGGSPASASLASFVAQLVSAMHCHRPLAQPTQPRQTVWNFLFNFNFIFLCNQEEHPGALSAVEDDKWHRAAATAELHSSLAHDIGHVVRAHCPMKWKYWKVMPDETRMEVCGQLSVALHEGWPQELEGQEDSWAWLCGHFQEADYLNPLSLATAVLKAEVEGRKRHGLKKLWLNRHVASGPHAPFNEVMPLTSQQNPLVTRNIQCTREVTEITNHQTRALNAFPRPRGENPQSGRRPRFAEIYGGHTTILLNPKPPCFTIRNANLTTHLPRSGSTTQVLSASNEGSKFLEIDVFGDIYVRPGNELAESLHTMMMEKSQMVLQESASQLPPDTLLESVDPPHDAGFQILTETLDQTLERRPGTYCRGMGNARRREPRARSSSQSKNQVATLTA